VGWWWWRDKCQIQFLKIANKKNSIEIKVNKNEKHKERKRRLFFYVGGGGELEKARKRVKN
jgi:hypothetical protein